MTPRTIAALWKVDLSRSLSDLIIEQTKHQVSRYDLTGSAPLFEVVHPLLLKSLKAFEEGSSLPGKQILKDMILIPSLEEAQNKHQIPILPAQPWVVAQYLVNKKTPIILDCAPLGAAVYRAEFEPDQAQLSIYTSLMDTWLNYALSPELWGPQGKWVRFHKRFVAVFRQKGLLREGVPGRYELQKRAVKLENFGFFGSLSGEAYTLTFPWTFPLSALVNFEKVILQEF